MPVSIDRRRLIGLLAAGPLVASLPRPARAEPVIGDVPLGNPDAPVTVIEYASFTCPHCAAFHQANWERLKREYIDTGKVYFIFRDVYFDRFGLWASMAARCAGPEAFHDLAAEYLYRQKEWTGVPEDQIGAAIMRIARLNGLTREQLEACLSDQDYARALIEDYQKNAAADGVTATPTFIVNGEKVVGNVPWEEFSKLIESGL